MKIMKFCCSETTSNSLTLSDVSSIANILIAALTLFLAYYVFVYQKNKAILSEKETEVLHKKNIKLQWFKEIIIQPRIQIVFNFYEQLNNLKNRFKNSELNDVEKIETINFIKIEQSTLRKSFLDLVQHVNIDLYKSMVENLDGLTDALTVAITNDELKLNNKLTYEREINAKIQKSYNDLLSRIFNYCG
jgi:hypothetical protein